MHTLGVLVFSLRGMSHLGDCLESVRWADEVKVVSTEGLEDRSIEIKTDWVLNLWGTERLEGDLREEIRGLCRQELTQSSLGYRIPVRAYLLGRWVEGSLTGPSPALRLSRRGGEIPSSWWDPAEGKVEKFPILSRGWIGDYSTNELKEGVNQIQGLSDFWAERLRDKGPSLSMMAMLLCPLQVFMEMSLKNGIFSNGFAGLTLSTLAAYATLLTSAKVWEARNIKEGRRLSS